ncbi:Hypothetical predicted protein [Lecanosticta acicola]|uniref:Uncharacterized protein n=1 Tax=Lecanosticta acicola TaxID=111012 RepID=A0AAI8YVN2_9PEZI|nr:Hypothetical predicted protein [Lecanosticta acicola]
MSSAEDLARLLLTLPQELYDEIYAWTFTANPGTRTIRRAETGRNIRKDMSGTSNQTKINRNLLFVSRATRAQFAASYYGGFGAKFLVDRELVIKWLHTLPEEHRDMFRQVKCLVRKGYGNRYIDFQLCLWKLQISVKREFGCCIASKMRI